MRLVIHRFFSFHAENVAPEIYWALGCVYLILIAVSLESLRRSQVRFKLAWAMLILFTPLIGMFFYALRSFFSADFSFLKRFGVSLPAGSSSAAPR